ncbi:putative two-component hybrid sensor and regulator [Sphingomonas changbaiensis NBRC 104936]|uniref:histidine kinase n=1 Tax=Sphingomonas changbaiensis NBRC 104936 TaxID=1219043 RepID=A0A0E9MKD0_9SPHN|nr:response regulator [Sphingomonas changbaiensis]GAO37866.1 putative two-component hybrid sensor and regulator [Sphingomonas changbaiensis NBRC 104936]
MTKADLPLGEVRILHLEDSALDADLICEFLRSEGMDCFIHRVWTRDEFRTALERERFDLILADHQLPNFDGEAALDIALEIAPQTPFIFVSGTLGEDVAVEAVKRGATDYVVKQRLERLFSVAKRGIVEAREREERRRAEAALRESERNFSTLVDAMPQLCWMANADGRITWYNRRWHEYTGTHPEDMDSWDGESVHDPAVLPTVQNGWRHSIETGEPFEMTFPLRGADGVFRPFLTRAVPVHDAESKVVRWLGTNTDVSAQYEAEAALKRLNEELESRVVAAIAEREQVLAQLGEVQKLETIGQLTGGVAHDFNNLLTPIMGNLDLLRQRLDGDDRGQRLLSGALKAAERAKTLVQRLLAFARKQVLEATAVDTAELVGGVTELIGRSIGPKVDIKVNAAPNLPPARVDPNQLELALLNLAVNARDAMPNGGVITVDIDAHDIGPDHPTGLRHGKYVRLSVIDTGAGMDSATMKRAIEPFFSTKGVGKGTGLGLSMVHGLAAQSGGALLLWSTPGQGTRADIWLPATSGMPEALRRDSTGDFPHTRPLAILLVDDEELVRTGTSEMLKDMGHSVTEASSASNALELLCGGLRPDLVVTDYLMPGMTGLDLAAAIRQMPSAPPILLLTGYAQLAGHEAGDLPLLPKPFRQSELAERLARIVSEGIGRESTDPCVARAAG